MKLCKVNLRSCNIIIVLCALTTLVWPFPVQANTGKQLLSNGGFETSSMVNGHLQPEDWTAGSRWWKSKVIVLDNKTVHSGKYSTRISVTKADNNSPKLETDYISVSGKIKVSGWMKTSRILQGARPWHKAAFYFIIFDKNKKRLGHEMTSGHHDLARVSGTTKWKKYQWEGILPDNVAYIRIVCSIVSTTGAAWFDDIKISKIPLTAVEKTIQQAKKVQLLNTQATKVSQSGRRDPYNYEKTHISMTPPPPVHRLDVKRPDFFAVVKGNGFYQNGKRVFLLGAESNATLYPYLYKLMGIDFVEMNDAGGNLGLSHKGDFWHAHWKGNPYIALEVRRLLRHKLMPYISFIERGKSTRARLFKYFPRMFAERGHFLTYSPLNPVGEKLRWNGRKAIMNGLGKLPVWTWELFNELYYRCQDKYNIDAFHLWAQKHYKTIQAANKAWGTHFSSFSQVIVPNPGWNTSWIAWRGHMPRGESKQLYVDFMKSQEIVMANYIGRSEKRTHHLDPAGLVTVQSRYNMMFDYGDVGVNPLLMAPYEDILGSELAQNLYIQGENDPVEIRDMLRTPLAYDVQRAAAGNRPIMGEEDTLEGRGGPKLSSVVLDNFKGRWQFLPLKGNPSGKGKQPPNLDVEGWTTIKVPGLWGPQGHADTQVAWYRRSFTLPGRSVLKPGYHLMLKGKALSDRAIIYVNGHKIYMTKSWSEAFSKDIANVVNWGGKNVVEIRIANHTRRGGYYLGGIRQYIKITLGQLPHPQPMTGGQMKTWLWTKAAHGIAGSVISYFYNNAASGAGPIFSPYRDSPAALKATAPTKKLIDDLASIVFTKPIRGQVAVVYPMTSFRYHMPKSYHAYLEGVLTSQLAKYYGALMFDHANVDMILDNHLKHIDRYKAVIVALEPRIMPDSLKKLKQYVEQGGILMIASDSLTTNEYLNAPLGKISWLPDRQDTGPNQEGLSVGKGHVYILPATSKSKLFKLEPLIDTLLKRSGIKPALTVKATGQVPADCVEAKRFTGKDGRTVWYLLNWGVTCKAVVGAGASSAFQSGKMYRVRNAVTRKIISSPTDQNAWTAEQLRQGIELTIPCQEPQLILIEPSSLSPLPLPRISPKLHNEIKQAFGPTIQSNKRILFTTQLYAHMTPVKIPTARKTIQQIGYGVYVALESIGASKTIKTWDGGRFMSQPLNSFKILAISCPQGNVPLGPAMVKVVKKFVAGGGGLLLLANPPHQPHGWVSPRNFNELAAAVGVHTNMPNRMVRDPKHNINSQALLPILTNITPSSITKGVTRIYPDGTGYFRLDKHSSAKVLIRTSSSAKPANAPVMAIARYGKGRVVVMANGYWLEPNILTKGDNRQLLQNIIRWLGQ